MSRIGSWEERFISAGYTLDDWHALQARRAEEMEFGSQFLTAGVDFARDRIEISIVDWVLKTDVRSSPRICISCGAVQSIDGMLPCGH